jgi:hypothetical protein
MQPGPRIIPLCGSEPQKCSTHSETAAGAPGRVQNTAGENHKCGAHQRIIRARSILADKKQKQQQQGVVCAWNEPNPQKCVRTKFRGQHFFRHSAYGASRTHGQQHDTVPVRTSHGRHEWIRRQVHRVISSSHTHTLPRPFSECDFHVYTRRTDASTTRIRMR